MRSGLAREIFKQDLLQIYSEQTERRDILTKQSRDAMKEIINQISSGVCENKTIEELISHLAERLKHTSGKKQYGYLKAPLKAVIDQIMDELAKDERVAKCYEQWYELRNEVLRTYADKLPPLLPLSRQKEFKSIKNMVIAEALHIGGGHYTFEPDEALEAFIDEMADGADETDNVDLYRKSAKQKNPYASYELAKMLRDGVGTEKDLKKADEHFHRAFIGFSELEVDDLRQDISCLNKQYRTPGIRGPEDKQNLIAAYLRLALDCVRTRIFLALEMQKQSEVQINPTEKLNMTM